MNNVRWGIIGCGDVTEVKSGPGFQKAQGSELVAVMRRTASLAEDYAKRHNVARWYSDADALINDPHVDAIYVATPPGSHLEYARKVAAAGKPCYMEKPMARSFAECVEMNLAFERAALPLFVAYYRRAQPRFVQIKQLIESGEIGTITAARYHFNRKPVANSGAWRVDATLSGGGLILDVGSHVIDLMDHLLGEFVEFSGSASSSQPDGVEDRVALHFRTQRQIIGSATWNFIAPDDDESLVIEGTEGSVSVKVMTPGSYNVTRRGETRTIAIADPPHVAQPLIQTVVDHLLGKNKCPSTGETGARASRVMDAALSHFYNGRNDEFWKRPQTWKR